MVHIVSYQTKIQFDKSNLLMYAIRSHRYLENEKGCDREKACEVHFQRAAGRCEAAMQHMYTGP